MTALVIGLIALKKLRTAVECIIKDMKEVSTIVKVIVLIETLILYLILERG